jgi:cytoskeletal protein RodZ
VSIGEALAAARHRAGLNVAEVSRRTRIRETIIRDIENGDYSACGGDFYARGHIRSIAKAVGIDPGPLIREYDANQRPHAMPDTDVSWPGTPIRTHKRRQLNQSAVVVVAVLVLVLAALGFAAYQLLSGSRPVADVAGRAHPATAHPAGNGRPNPAPNASRSAAHTATATATPPRAAAPAPAVPARTLTPVSAAAFGPGGPGQGDNPDRASLAIDGNTATAWHTDWYTTAHFGNLYPGTGLLLDMGRTTVITSVRITLGSSPGTSFQLRAGAVPALAGLPPVAHAAAVGGVVRLRPTPPAHGRYLLIWFTRLPPTAAGTFQASVYDIALAGRA